MWLAPTVLDSTVLAPETVKYYPLDKTSNLLDH